MKRLSTCPRLLASVLLASIVVAARLETTASAALIVWGSPQSISGDSDVSTTGTLLYAYNIGGAGVSGTTVNGVAFAPLEFPTNGSGVFTTGNVSYEESPGLLVPYGTLGSLATPYSALSSAYKTLLDSGGSATYAGTITFTLGGLTLGQDYSLQWWTSNAANRNGDQGESIQLTTATATNSVQLDANVTGTAGGLGQYVIGTFTASGTTQVFTLASPGGFPETLPLINAFQIRAVPEPSTCIMALAGIACGGFSMWQRRKRPHKTSGRCQAVTRILAIVAMCMVCCSMRSADAVPTLADISWGSATNISGDSDVDTIGTLVYAYNFGSGTSATTQTINGVTFQPSVIDTGTNSQTTGNVTVSEDSGYIGSDFYLGSGTPPFSGLGSSYGSLLSSEVYANNSATMQVDLGGLTPGNSYRVQWWTNDSASLTGAESNLLFEDVIASGSSSMVTLDSNSAGIDGGLGQYVIGTFTANNAIESFTLVGSGTGGLTFPMMNALQLRTVAVPEPTTYAMALAGLACGGFSMRRRRKRA